MTAKVKADYREGDWFSVPLHEGGYAVGVVARVGSKGTLLGYFFGPLLQTQPHVRDVCWNRSDSAVLIAIVGDLGLRRGEWRLLGHPDGWSRARWPLPKFARRDALSGTAKIVTYTDHDLVNEVEIQSISNDAADRIPEDGVWGYGAVEKRLSRLLGADSSNFAH
jgi:hypothetical protein